jgi:hypothetical protein
LWADAAGSAIPSAGEMNRMLHAERLHGGTHRRRLHSLPWQSLPDGTFALVNDVQSLVLGDQLVDWTHAGYGRRRQRPARGDATVITPPSTIAVLRAGYPVQIDATARG